MVELRDFKIHPILCTYLGGYFLGILKLTGIYKKTIIKETKCPFKGDNCHEYLMKWTYW